MKPQKILLLLLVVFSFLVTVGCGNKTETAQESNNAEIAASEQVTIPKERPQLIGKIKDVVGNEVTIYKAEMNEATVTENENEPNQSSADQEQNLNEQAQKQNSNEQTTNPEDPNNGGPSQPKKLALNFTEETVTITIPVGTQIASAGRGTAELMEISDLKAEQTIMVWQRDDTVTFVQVMGGNKSTTKNEQNQNNMQGAPAGGPPAGGQIIRGGNK